MLYRRLAENPVVRRSDRKNAMLTRVAARRALLGKPKRTASSRAASSLVTGASSGMGKDIAKRLLAAGYEVYAGARRIDRKADLRLAGAHTLPLDVTVERSIMEVADQIAKTTGRVDRLVNAASYGQYGALKDVPMDEARRQMETNLFGLARLAQLCLPTMRAQGSGRILNISSIGGKFALPLGGWYHASKFALEGYSDALRNEVRQFGIDVVVIEPGGFASEWESIAADAAKRVSGSGYRLLQQHDCEVQQYAGPKGTAAKHCFGHGDEGPRCPQAGDPIQWGTSRSSSALPAPPPFRSHVRLARNARFSLAWGRLSSGNGDRGINAKTWSCAVGGSKRTGRYAL